MIATLASGALLFVNPLGPFQIVENTLWMNIQCKRKLNFIAFLMTTNNKTFPIFVYTGVVCEPLPSSPFFLVNIRNIVHVYVHVCTVKIRNKCNTRQGFLYICSVYDIIWTSLQSHFWLVSNTKLTHHTYTGLHVTELK